MLKYIPNVLSFSRLTIGIVFPLVPTQYWLVLILVGLLTEFFDGWLARRFHWATDFGTFLDPLADRIFFIFVAVTLVNANYFSGTALIMVGVRDILMILGGIMTLTYFHDYSSKTYEVQLSGKITTALQYAFLVCIFVYPQGIDFFVFVTFISGLVASASYFLRWSSSIEKKDEGKAA